VPPSRSLTWRLVPWLFPIALILVGLVFVASSLTGTDHPDPVAAPPNVRDITVYNAPGWARRQVLDGSSSEVIGVVMVASSATGAATYSIRAVIGRVDSPAVVRTVITCVAWEINVSTGAVTEHGAEQLSNEVGRHGLGDESALTRRCRAATLVS
jgi:hypothetical protein